MIPETNYLIYYKSFGQDKTCNISSTTRQGAIDLFNHHFKGCQFVDIKDDTDIANDIFDALMNFINKSFENFKNKKE